MQHLCARLQRTSQRRRRRPIGLGLATPSSTTPSPDAIRQNEVDVHDAESLAEHEQLIRVMLSVMQNMNKPDQEGHESSGGGVADASHLNIMCAQVRVVCPACVQRKNKPS